LLNFIVVQLDDATRCSERQYSDINPVGYASQNAVVDAHGELLFSPHDAFHGCPLSLARQAKTTELQYITIYFVLLQIQLLCMIVAPRVINSKQSRRRPSPVCFFTVRAVATAVLFSAEFFYSLCT